MLVLSAVAIISVLNVGGAAGNVINRYQQWLTIPSFRWFELGVVTFLFLVSVLFLIFSLRREKTPPDIEQVMENGHLSISVTAIDSLVRKKARKFNEIHDLKVRIRVNETQMVSIGLKAVVDGKTPIPILSKLLQEAVKEEIETIAEMKVDEVTVKITDIIQPKRSKVRVE